MRDKNGIYLRQGDYVKVESYYTMIGIIAEQPKNGLATVTPLQKYPKRIYPKQCRGNELTKMSPEEIMLQMLENA